MYFYPSICVSLTLNLCTYVFISLYLCVAIPLSVYRYLSVCVSLTLNLCTYVMYVYLSICVFQSLYLCIAISLSVYCYPSLCVSLKLSRYLPSCIPISQSVHRYSFLVSDPLSEKGFLFFQIQLFLLPTANTLSFFVHIFMALEKVAMLYCGDIAQ